MLKIAKSDDSLLPSAFVLVRSQMECTTRLRWLLQPKGRLDRQARLLVLMQEVARSVDQTDMARQESAPTGLFLELRANADALQAAIQNEVELLPGVPSMAAMQDALNFSTHTYGEYRFMSQFSHGTLLDSTFTRPPFD